MCNKKYFCDGCLIYFYSKEKLDLHLMHDCNHVYTKIPTTKIKINKYGQNIPENILQFENFKKQLKLPFVIYADFKCPLKPLPFELPENNLELYTRNTFKHEPYAFAYFIKCSYDDSLSVLDYYFGVDAAQEFCKRIEQHVHRIYNNHLKPIIPMISLTEDEENTFKYAQNCHICNSPFKPEDVKARNHCHLTGKFIGPAHAQTCNLNYKIPNFIPLFFHNLSYDLSQFIRHLPSEGEKIEVIAQTKEKYISLTKVILVDKIEQPD